MPARRAALLLLLLLLAASSFALPSAPASPDASATTAEGALYDYLRALQAQQHPPKASCRSRRLLLTQFSARHFEGIGSLLKLLFMGLAEAAHSNRTLVWGLDLPYLFEHSREVWQGPDPASPFASVAANGLELDCRGWQHAGGGPYNCLFLPLSSCSLEDASPEELAQLGADGFSDASRLRIQEARRGVSLYHPPAPGDLFRHVARAAHPAHTWAAAVAAFAFRLKPKVLEALEARRVALWAGSSGEACGGGSGDRREGRPTWAMHVRRGDVAALKTTYGNRQSFDFPDFWARALERARRVKDPAALPGALLVLADDPEAPQWVEGLCAPRAQGLSAAARRAAPSLDDWPGGRARAPRVFTVAGASRAHTPHGSHTVAADGGCQLETCALPAEVVLHYRDLHAKTGAPPRSARLMRVLLESVEDLYNLAHGDVLFAQSTSHYSTAACLLAWARSGAPSPAATEFLDQAAVEEGLIATSFLHFASMNLTTAVPAGRGHERWIRHTKLFKEGLARADTAGCGRNVDGYLFTCDGDPRERMRVVDLVPHMPQRTFDAEAARWGGAAGVAPWAGECPLNASVDGAPFASLPAKTRLIELINHGAAHSELHPNQAMVCWKMAAGILEALLAEEVAGRQAKDEDLAVYEDVLSGNAAAIASRSMYPYSLPRERVAQILLLNLGSDAARALGDGVMRLPPGKAAAAAAAAALAAPATSSSGGKGSGGSSSSSRSSGSGSGGTSKGSSGGSSKGGSKSGSGGSSGSAKGGSGSSGSIKNSAASPSSSSSQRTFAPLQLGCHCPASRTGSNSSLLAVGWEGVPHSYAIMLKGLLGGMLAAEAHASALRNATAWSFDFLAAPAYRRSWVNASDEPDARFSVSRSGALRARHEVHRVLPQDAIAPPLLFGSQLPPSAFAPPPAPPGAPAPAWAARQLRKAGGGAPPACPTHILRAAFPLDLSPPPCAGARVWVFGTTELHTFSATDVHQALPSGRAGGHPPNPFAGLPASVRLLTPSRWSAEGFVTAGAPRDRIDVLPHGFDPDLFRPLDARARGALRRSLGWDDGCVVVLSVGHMRWKKGADLLLRAVAGLSQELRGNGTAAAQPRDEEEDEDGAIDGPRPRCVRLVLKGLDALYDSSAVVARYLAELSLPARGSAPPLALGAAVQRLAARGALLLELRGGAVPDAAVAELMQAADVYASPYRAEGFNLPVLEAAASGLPLVVTRGGPTADYTDASFAAYVDADLIPRGAGAEGGDDALHLEARAADLQRILMRALRNSAWRAAAGARAAAWVRERGFTWEAVAEKHLRLFGGEEVESK